LGRRLGKRAWSIFGEDGLRHFAGAVSLSELEGMEIGYNDLGGA